MVAIEDKRFYDHYGIDPRRLVRVLWDNMVTSGRPGASTLTQQLARNLFLTADKTLTRKVKEWILALQIEQIYTKDEILAMYLNQIYMGRGTYGMQAAARLYFGKDVWDLQPAETTLLAGIIQRPNKLSPFDNLEPAYQRRATVLQTMVAAGFLTRDEAERIGATEVAVVGARAQPRRRPLRRLLHRGDPQAPRADLRRREALRRGPARLDHPRCRATSAGWRRPPRAICSRSRRSTATA